MKIVYSGSPGFYLKIIIIAVAKHAGGPDKARTDSSFPRYNVAISSLLVRRNSG
jgi:hypothetical protein